MYIDYFDFFFKCCALLFAISDHGFPHCSIWHLLIHSMLFFTPSIPSLYAVGVYLPSSSYFPTCPVPIKCSRPSFHIMCPKKKSCLFFSPISIKISSLVFFPSMQYLQHPSKEQHFCGFQLLLYGLGYCPCFCFIQEDCWNNFLALLIVSRKW